MQNVSSVFLGAVSKMKRKQDEEEELAAAALSNGGASASAAVAAGAETTDKNNNATYKKRRHVDEIQASVSAELNWSYYAHDAFIHLVYEKKYEEALKMAYAQFQFYDPHTKLYSTRRIENQESMSSMEFYKFILKAYAYFSKDTLFSLTKFMHENFDLEFDETPCDKVDFCDECLLAHKFIEIHTKVYLLKHAKHLNAHKFTFRDLINYYPNTALRTGYEPHEICDWLLECMYRSKMYGPPYFQNRDFDWKPIYLCYYATYVIKRLVCRYFVPLNGMRELTTYMQFDKSFDDSKDYFIIKEHSRFQYRFHVIKILIAFGCAALPYHSHYKLSFNYVPTVWGSNFRFRYCGNSGPIYLAITRVLGFLRCANTLYLALHHDYFRNRNVLTYLLLYYAPRFYTSQLYWWKDCQREFEIHTAVEWCLKDRARADSQQKNNNEKREMYLQSICDLEFAHYEKSKTTGKENIAWLTLNAETSVELNGKKIDIPRALLKSGIIVPGSTV